MESDKTITVEVYSDFACPWCYVGRKKLQLAISHYSLKKPSTKIKITYCPYMINPVIEKEGIELTAEKKSAMKCIKGIEEAAGGAFGNWKYMPNTLLAHCLALQASKEEKVEAVYDELFRLTYEAGKNVSDPLVLREVAKRTGVVGFWETKEYEQEVIEASRFAREVGEIQVVPYFVIENEVALQGANEPTDFIEIFDKYFLP